MPRVRLVVQPSEFCVDVVEMHFKLIVIVIPENQEAVCYRWNCVREQAVVSAKVCEGPESIKKQLSMHHAVPIRGCRGFHQIMSKYLKQIVTALNSCILASSFT